MKLPLEGGCLCGRLRYRIARAPHHADYCHCRLCQRASGAPVVAWLTTENADFAWTAGEPAVYRSSPGAERLFCPQCGTPLVFRELAAPDTLDVTLASLDDPAAVVPGHHIWTSSRIAWFETADTLPRYPERGRAEPAVWASAASGRAKGAERPFVTCRPAKAGTALRRPCQASASISAAVKDLRPAQPARCARP